MIDTRVSAASIRLTIDGRSVEVAAGSTVAAALALAGAQAQAVGNSIGGTRLSVSGQPRAALCGMGVCQECRVTVDGRSHVLACQTLCREGAVIQTSAAKPTADTARTSAR